MSLRTRALFAALQLAVSAASVPALAQSASPAAPVAPNPSEPAPGGFMARFDAANTTHDGHLTQAQAQTAGMKGVVRHFAAIDAQHKGYVTPDDIRAYHREERAARAARAGGPAAGQTGAPPQPQ